jgi:hypothetical protein
MTILFASSFQDDKDDDDDDGDLQRSTIIIIIIIIIIIFRLWGAGLLTAPARPPLDPVTVLDLALAVGEGPVRRVHASSRRRVRGPSSIATTWLQ